MHSNNHDQSKDIWRHCFVSSDFESARILEWCFSVSESEYYISKRCSSAGALISRMLCTLLVAGVAHARLFTAPVPNAHARNSDSFYAFSCINREIVLRCVSFSFLFSYLNWSLLWWKDAITSNFKFRKECFSGWWLVCKLISEMRMCLGQLSLQFWW